MFSFSKSCFSSCLCMIRQEKCGIGLFLNSEQKKKKKLPFFGERQDAIFQCSTLFWHCFVWSNQSSWSTPRKGGFGWGMGWWREHKHEVKPLSVPLKLGTSQTGFGKGNKGEVADSSLQEIYLNQRITLGKQHAPAYIPF